MTPPRPGLTMLFAGLLTLVVLGAGGAIAQETRFIRIGTGGVGGTYFPVGGLIANAISSPPGGTGCQVGGSCGVRGVIAAAVATQGSVENADLVSRQKLDLALCQADVAHDITLALNAFAGKAPLSNLRAIGNLFAEQVHVVVRRDAEIRGFGDLVGRRVSLGEPNSGTRVAMMGLLAAAKIQPPQLDIVLESVDAASDGLVDGRIAAFAIVGGYPISAVSHAAERTPIALVPVTGELAATFRRQRGFYTGAVIPAGTYPGSEATATIAVAALLIAAAEMDEDLVYKITAALWDPRNARILTAGGEGRRFRLDRALDGVSIPLHPGAARYYGEIGLRLAGEL